MIIRKQFKFEGGHMVRNCSSTRCQYSIHGHSLIVEVFLTSDRFDNGMMVYDFGLMKGTINEFIDSFDHTYSLWRYEKTSVSSFIKEHSARWIEMPISPSAEGYALFFLYWIDKILSKTEKVNGEGNVKVRSVRVHETATGYAEAFVEDLVAYNNDPKAIPLAEVAFSEGVQEEWKELTMEDLHKAAYANELVWTNKHIEPVVTAPSGVVNVQLASNVDERGTV